MTVQAPPRAGTYRAVYADPPWRFATYSDKGKGRSAEAHYDCMTLPEIKAMPVGSWAAAESVLFLWTTDPMLRHALDVIEAWGFTYKTVAFYWVKLNKGRDGIFMSRATSSPAWDSGPAPTRSCACSRPGASQRRGHRRRQAAGRRPARAFPQARRDLSTDRAAG